MANLKEIIEWVDGIYQLETTDPVMGGPNGIDNLQAKQLGNRTQFLKKSLEDLADKVTNVDNSIPTVPVQSVNGKTGDINITAADVNALTREQALNEFLPASKKIGSDEQPLYEVGAFVVFKAFIGDHRLFPFRASELPPGWYVRNGDNYPLGSPQGVVLNSLSDNYKRDYQITIKTISGQKYINVPTAFASDGRGLFERPVDGTTRQVGTVQNDAIRDIWGHFDTGVVPHHDEYTKGAFFGTTAINPTNTAFQSSTSWQTCGFDFYASRVVPTANENRPINIGLTPAIYLGV